MIKQVDEKALPKPQAFYVGGYTDGENEGVYKFLFHDNGSITKIGLAAKTDNPSFLAKSPDQKYLIAVNEVNIESTGGTVESYLINKDLLELISRESSAGADPCFVAINNENFILTANYSSGSVGLLQLSEEGKLSTVLDTQQHAGSGSHDRQKSTHAHSVWFVPGSDEIIAIDLGTNQLLFSRLDPKSKTLKPQKQASLSVSPGAGPRHLTFHPDGQWFYVSNELNSTVSLIKKNEEDVYHEAETFSSLPVGYEDDNTCSDLRMSVDGKFLYVANRGHDSIAVFKASFSDGSLTLLGHKSCGGKNPRSLTFSPKENFLLIANQESDNIVVLSRDKTSGLLKYKHQAETISPSFIMF